jgi:CheY-like chemotaxis protein
MNGRQFLIEAKKHDRLRAIPIIILSTSSDHATISETAALGAADFITKPNKLSLLEVKLLEIFSNPIYNPV